MTGELYPLGEDLYLVDLQTDALSRAPTVAGVLATTDEEAASFPLVVRLPAEATGLEADLAAKMNQLHTRPRSQLPHPVARLPAELVEELAAAVSQILVSAP